MSSISTGSITVKKYGGATLSNPEKIRAVAEQLAQLSKAGNRIVAVVSAMGSTTNELLDLAHAVSEKPNRREMDMLLSTGERISMALLSMALQDLGVPAISFTGSQAGILTNTLHSNAFIEDVKAFRVAEALEAGKVVVLAGFQGVNATTKEITTLGRGGSDTTAVAMAAFLNASRCEILKDVPAVFSADPKLVPDAQVIENLNYAQMMEMTFWGAKVLHYRSVELAQQKNIQVYVGPAHGKDQKTTGTLIKGNTIMYESSKILAINSFSQVFEIQCLGHDAAQSLKDLRQFLDQQEIAFPQILHINQSNLGCQILITAPDENMKSIQDSLKATNKFKLETPIWSSVTATCTGITSGDLTEKILSQLQKEKINVQKVLQTAMSTTLIVENSQREKSIQALHNLMK